MTYTGQPKKIIDVPVHEPTPDRMPAVEPTPAPVREPQRTGVPD